jgi:PadR family transcriptional regulator PadR
MAFKSDLETLILAVLQEGDLHGYEISKRITNAGSTALRVWEGQLYPALHKMEKRGYLCATWIPQEGKPPRKIYALTEDGHKMLVNERNAWKEFSVRIDALLSPKSTSIEGAK